MNRIAENFDHVHRQINQQALAAGRDPESIHLVAVSKKQPDERIRAALDTGHRLFGENRVQEAQKRWGPLRDQYDDVQLHLIGPLQTNKVRDAVALFDCIETVDRKEVAEKLAEEMNRQNRDLPCFIQVNTGKEMQKAGIAPEAVGEFADYCKYSLGLDIRGLMCLPPVDDPPALHFALLRKLARECGYEDLSMGMSNDFEKAIPLGATYMRIGSALFGDRPSDP